MKRFILLAILGIVLFIGCEKEIVDPPKKIENVVRILMHEPNRYTFLYRTTLWQSLGEKTLSSYDISIFEDVLIDQSNWVQYSFIRQSSWDTPRLINCTEIQIHVHSAQDISGAGWDHGKSGRGSTTVIE